MQQPGEPGKVQSVINVTPLVDVVLVLLIIFMVVAPQMRPGPEVDLPDTAKPKEQDPQETRILVTIDEKGGLWIEDAPVTAEHLGEDLRAAAATEEDPKIVIQAHAARPFGEVRQAMLTIEEAGFEGVGLLAERTHKGARGG